jgi:bacillithiol biosynthesis cysteine-adding enzyme BshC
LLLTHDYQLAPFTAPTTGIANFPVANVRLAPGMNELTAKAAELLGDSLAADYLREAYREGETFSDAFAKLYTSIFSEQGLILLDPNDPELHRIAAPLFVEAALRSPELDEALLDRNRELTSLHYHEQVKITEQSTPLFALVEGARVPVHRANGEFTIARERLSPSQLQQRIEAHPEEFSANVLLRPVLQDYWLPTLGYFGGPAEIAYFAQVAVVYEKLLGRVTPVLPRLSATLIEPRIERLLTKYDLDLTEIFHGECQLRDCLAAKVLPADLKQSFEQGSKAIDQVIQRITASLEKLDPTLVEAAANAASKMRHQIETLEKRAGQAELRRSDVLARHAAQIENALYPHKELQEREIAAVYFHAGYGPQLIDRLLDSAQARCPEHKVILLG